MSLIVTADDPEAPKSDSDRHFQRPAGVERARHTLWGTEPIARRSPMLAEIATDLHVPPEQFDEFERQCLRVMSEADQVAEELAGEPTSGEFLRDYVKNFLDALAFAREHRSEMIRIW